MRWRARRREACLLTHRRRPKSHPRQHEMVLEPSFLSTLESVYPRKMPSTRHQRAAAVGKIGGDASESDDDSSSSDEEDEHYFNGIYYKTYELMVQAKRERNRQRLEDSGLLQASRAFRDDVDASKAAKKGATKRGIKTDKKRKAAQPLPRRKSSRIAGVRSDGMYVEDERAGRFTIAGSPSAGGSAAAAAAAGVVVEVEKERFFNDRINE